MPQITLRIPTPLRGFTGGASDVAVELDDGEATVGGALRALGAKHPDVTGRILTDDGALRTFVNVFAGDEAVRDLDERVADGAVLHIIPAVAGGTAR
ncbi:MAG: MoaD/ThiS family protein [Acidobacteriota bacterium]